MNLVWLLNRLRSMSPAELAWRVREQAVRKSARGRLDTWDAYDPAGIHAPQLLGIRSALERASPELKTVTEAAAKRVLSGHFRALGVTWPTIDLQSGFAASQWTLDPVTGKHWPGAETFSFDIEYRHASGYGDIKYAWEFHRLQFLQPVAAYYLFSRDPEALSFLEVAIGGWCEHNPPYRGFGWNSGIELALRAISLLFVSSCCGPDLSAETQQRIRLILVSHLEWIQRFPSRYSSANNHLVAECAGEFLIALAMPELPKAATVLDKAAETLRQEADKQILDDGVGAEQSPTYGAFTAEFLLLCAKAARDAGRPLDRGVDAALLRFARFVSWIAASDAVTPNVCDDDEGRVISSAEQEKAYPASVAAAIWGYLGMSAEGPVPAMPSLRDAVFDSPRHSAVGPSGVRTFQTGGYSLFRGDIAGRRALLMYDHGPLGYLSIAAHGHADALAWQLFLDDHPVLVDPGTYRYHAGGAWRDWFRGTAAHNTLCLGDRDQSIISGPFNWSHKAKAQLLEHGARPVPYFRATHDGYLKPFKLVHERTLSVLPSSIRVADRLVGDASPPKVDMTYQLAVGAEAEVAGDCVHVRLGGKAVLKIDFPAGGDLSIVIGQGPQQGGWVSNAFGVKEPAPRIVWTTGAFPPEAVTEFHIL